MSEMVDFNTKVINEFHENGGKVGGMFDGAPMILLHHTGARSGVERVTPLVYLDEDDRIFIFASKAGADDNPAWYHNLLANPQTTVEIGTETFGVTASVLQGAERDGYYAKQAAKMPGFADYQRKTTRVIPVVELKRT